MIRVAALLGMLALAQPALAETPPIPCEGQIAVLYHNQIKPGGTLDGLVAAAKAQEAWYRSQGIQSNRILVAKVVRYDSRTKQSSYAADEVFTLHVNPPLAEKSGAKQDFVELYRKNATVLDRKTICLPTL